MSEPEWRAFVTHGTRTAALATVRRDGRPHVAPIWFVLDDDGSVVFTTAADSVKGKTLRRDPWVSLCVDDQTPPFAFVMIEGTTTISADLDEMLGWATRIGARYMGPIAPTRSVAATRSKVSFSSGSRPRGSWPAATSRTSRRSARRMRHRESTNGCGTPIRPSDQVKKVFSPLDALSV